MLKLKVKHKLLLIWLGSIVLTLSVMAMLFEYQIGALHQEEARSAVSNAINILHQDLELQAQQVDQSSQTLSARGDLISSMSMINSYQDIDNYQPSVFDIEKSKIALELAQHATATGMDTLALFDTKGVLAAFYLSPTAGGNGAGYVSFQDGKMVPFVQNAQGGFTATDDAYMAAVMRQLSPLDRTPSLHAQIYHTTNNSLLISTARPMERKRPTGQIQQVGAIIVGRALGDTFSRSLSRATGMNLRILFPEHHDPSVEMNELDAMIIAHNVPRMVLNGNPAPDHSTAHIWFSTQNLYVGTVRMEKRKGPPFYFVFTQRKDTLQSTLNAFRNTVLLVLFATGLTLIPVGVFFLNRFITHPIENLVESADNLRRGQHRAMEGLTSADEFGKLASAFQEMSAAVLAREKSLIESQASLKNAQRIAHIGNWEWDLQSDVISLSDELHFILDRHPETMSTTFEALMMSVHPDDADSLKHRIDAAVETGSGFKMEHRIVQPNGNERYVLHHGEIQYDGAVATRLSATVQDITERYLLERAKSDLISTVSHELRTPLTSITGTLGLAVGGVLGELPDQLKSMLTTADKNAQKLGLLIDDLLDIEKIANGSMTFAFKPVSVAEVFQSAMDVTETLAQNHKVTLSVEGDVDNIKLYADPGRITQVMANLISNAIKFSPTESKVLIRARRTGSAVTISVSDRGAGIPENFRPHVFERFAQADQTQTRSDQKGGTGLGLSITKAIVEMHDGNISFESICAPAPNHGTTFKFSIPAWNEISPQTENTHS
ncbi:HAMP domain-containing sensor histidine kinase [Magnetovibrio sp.]|uniref:HAMP domain-containing sensor histidine kinase n=1 Tax=Magnetovibrio sp. TaxID=2024836 RepID=UPI002F948B4A